MKIGAYNLHVIETGEFALDGGSMFGVVPKSLWQKLIPVDEKNRVSLNLRCLLLQGNQQNILIDTGIGEKGSDKFQQMFRIDHSRYNLQKALAAHQLSCADITDVILTHLHFDHAGGATKTNEHGEIIPTFPNATYYVQAENLHWALNPTEKDRASYLQENFVPLQTSKQLKVLHGECEPFEGIKMLCFDGHTKGQQLPLIYTKKTKLFFCADLFPTSVHISPPWIMAYDNEPLTTLCEKKLILQKACAENWSLFFEHCPHFAMGKIKQDQNAKFSLIPTNS